MFRVQICVKDIPTQRILLREEIRDIEPETFEMCVKMFGATCSSISAVLKKNKNEEGFEEQYPKVVDAIRNRYYTWTIISTVRTVKIMLSM